MEKLENYHAIQISFVSPTNLKPARVRIKSERFEQSVIIPFWDAADTFNTGQKWLLDSGFNLIGQAEGKDCYIILSTTFKSLK